MFQWAEELIDNAPEESGVYLFQNKKKEKFSKKVQKLNGL